MKPLPLPVMALLTDLANLTPDVGDWNQRELGRLVVRIGKTARAALEPYEEDEDDSMAPEAPAQAEPAESQEEALRAMGERIVELRRGCDTMLEGLEKIRAYQIPTFPGIKPKGCVPNWVPEKLQAWATETIIAVES